MNDESDTSKSWNNPLFVDSDKAARLAESQRYGEVLRRKVADGWALGTFVVELPVPAVLRAIALAGFDFVVLDMEHSAVDFPHLESLIAVGHSAGLPVLVRPRSHDDGLIGRILDLGANGIMVPRVETAEQARAVVDQSRFPPLGQRGFSPLTRYDALKQPLRALNDSTYLMLQIEGRRGIEHARDIASVPGIDAIFVGPYDLALSLGVPPGSERVSGEAVKLAKSMPRGLQLGIYVDDPARCGEWAARRYTLQCVSFDGRMLSGAARSLVAAARKGMKRKRSR
jgi:2-keto-3-deoxy-L-rhamnonate aldolase RhmA